MSYDLENRFSYHTATPRIAAIHVGIRDTLLQIATDFEQILPVCRETSLALTKLEEAMFWANAAVARNHDHFED